MPKDYKRPPKQPGPARPRHQNAPSRAVWFVSGLACGVLGSLAVAWFEPSPEAVLASIDAMRERQPKAERPLAEPKPRFEFYHLLPEMEVAVPEHELDAPAPAPAPRVETGAPVTDSSPGGTGYVIQVGSFRQAAEAERLRASLALQGIEARVQSVAIDGRETWHRVRLGPFADVGAVNAMRRRLQGLDVGAMVVKLKG